MSLDKFLWFSLKLLMVVLLIELILIIAIASKDNEDEFNSFMPTVVDSKWLLNQAR